MCRYDDDNTEPNLDINKAVATLKSVKRWAVSQYLVKWVVEGLVLGAGSYGAMSYKTGSWFDWRSCTLGVTTFAGPIAYGFYKLNSPQEQNKVREK